MFISRAKASINTADINPFTNFLYFFILLFYFILFTCLSRTVFKPPAITLWRCRDLSSPFPFSLSCEACFRNDNKETPNLVFIFYFFCSTVKVVPVDVMHHIKVTAVRWVLITLQEAIFSPPPAGRKPSATGDAHDWACMRPRYKKKKSLSRWRAGFVPPPLWAVHSVHGQWWMGLVDKSYLQAKPGSTSPNERPPDSSSSSSSSLRCRGPSVQSISFSRNKGQRRRSFG